MGQNDDVLDIYTFSILAKRQKPVTNKTKLGSFSSLK